MSTHEFPSPMRPATVWIENGFTSHIEKGFELWFDNISAVIEPNYEHAIILPKKKVSPNALVNFTSELYKIMPVLNDISDEELERIIENSSDDAED